MVDWFVSTLRSYPEIEIFLSLALGYYFCSSFAGLGAVTATLIAAVIIGQLGITISPPLKATMFLMFLLALGYGVGRGRPPERHRGRRLYRRRDYDRRAGRCLCLQGRGCAPDVVDLWRRISGLFFGCLRSVHPPFGRIPSSKVGFMNSVVFITVVGISSGELRRRPQELGFSLFLWGVVATTVPLVKAMNVGKYIFRFHPAILLGAPSEARTTAASRGMTNDRAKSQIPGLDICHLCGRE